MSSSTLAPSAVEAARMLCQEARVVLTSLRGGPPHIARGELAQDLMELRDRIPVDLERHHASSTANSNNSEEDNATANDNNHETKVSAEVPFFTPALMEYASRPFLAVVTDPRASGPHTAVALQSIRRLLERRVLTANEPLTRGILGCKFEQTNAAQDEAVEMAIADVLSLCLQQMLEQQQDDSNSPITELVQEAFHTVFVTRNTFVHNSPALGYHLEHVLVQMVQSCANANVVATRIVLEFLLHQLLHTPLTPQALVHSNSGGSSDHDHHHHSESHREAHDSTRVLCLRLVRLALDPWWGSPLPSTETETEAARMTELLPLIQDDLCLSLLMTGQAIWHYTGSGSGGGAINPNNPPPSLVSPAVLTEICATIIYLWNCPDLRPHLMGPFESIWTGFYTRALALLRRRREAVNAAAYHANLIFDAELEIILESLVDLLQLQPPPTSDTSAAGALETIFVYYDCHLQRSDVAVGLIVELCRACGGAVNEEGMALVSGSGAGGAGTINNNNAGSSSSSLNDAVAEDVSISGGSSTAGDPCLVQVDHPWRPVPAHLKELCAVALMGGMKCLFRDAAAAAALQNAPTAPVLRAPPSNSHMLRTIKSQKRFMRKAARIFNHKPSRGIDFLVDCGLLSEPITPLQVATFLRHAIVVGLDKAAVGSYLGEAGKAAPNKSGSGSGPSVWERDWFHKECLEAYCGLFSFQDQSLLDSLRMFLAAFRLPGEAQQIDRILQAFADKCAALCQEGGAGGLLSDDPKRASDAAYLLSFSIIMLNTDQHNTNIRADRKMTVDDFVKNNTDYGRDITEPGKELPREYLVAIYDSIRQEEIRTEGEGAEGAMTVERWKDVLRQAHAQAAEEAGEATPTTSLFNTAAFSPPQLDTVEDDQEEEDDLTELVLEHVWKPILSAIGAFWNVSGRFPSAAGSVIDDDPGAAGATSIPAPPMSGNGGSSHGFHGNVSGGGAAMTGGNAAANHHAAMLGVQGARLGMDMSLEMLHGVRQLGRLDIYRKLFAWVCDYTGLLQQQQQQAGGAGTAICTALVESVEAQSAVLVALCTAVDAGEDLDVDGWKRVWALLLELRDAHLLPKCLLQESEDDLLRPARRREWTLAVVAGDMTDVVADYASAAASPRSKKRGAKGASPGGKPTTMLGAFGRALFGSDEPEEEDFPPRGRHGGPLTGKEDAVIWDEVAPSDDEEDDEGSPHLVKGGKGSKESTQDESATELIDEGGDEEEEDMAMMGHLSPGAAFESQLIRESMDQHMGMDTPVTGLERAEETVQRSPRARLRTRLQQSCQGLEAFVADSRFLDDESIKQALLALMDLIPTAAAGAAPSEIMDPSKLVVSTTPIPKPQHQSFERSMSDVSISTPSFAANSNWNIPVSPASEAFAEVLICEIALKNRDRLKMLWTDLLQDHYISRLASQLGVTASAASEGEDGQVPVDDVAVIPDPGLEKRISGMLRLSVCATKRGPELANDILASWKDILPVIREQQAQQSPFKALHRQLSEGMWRIVSSVCASEEGLPQLLGPTGWQGVLALLNWSSARSCTLPPIQGSTDPLSEDDPAVQTYRSLHSLLNQSAAPSSEAGVPSDVIDCLRTLVAAGDTRNYPQLSMASLDLLQLLNQKKAARLDGADVTAAEVFCATFWRRIVQAVAEAAEHPRFSNVRQHALSMLTNLFLDRQNAAHIPVVPHLYRALTEVCVPLAGRCIVSMQTGHGAILPSSDELMIEFELCIGLIFKPFRHHLEGALSAGDQNPVESHVYPLWKAVLAVLEELLTASRAQPEGEQQVIPENLQSTMHDLATEHLQNAIVMLVSRGVLAAGSSDDLSKATRASVMQMGINEETLNQWIQRGE